MALHERLGFHDHLRPTTTIGRLSRLSLVFLKKRHAYEVSTSGLHFGCWNSHSWHDEAWWCKSERFKKAALANNTHDSINTANLISMAFDMREKGVEVLRIECGSREGYFASPCEMNPDWRFLSSVTCSRKCRRRFEDRSTTKWWSQDREVYT